MTMDIHTSQLKWFLVILLFSFNAMAGGAKRPSAEEPAHRKPKSGAKVYKPTGQWDIKGVSDIPKNIGSGALKGGVIVWDLEGAILDGEKQKGKLDDNESNEPLFRARVPLVVKNGFARNVKNAMTFFAKDSGVEKMTFTEIGEDALATPVGEGAPGNIRVIDSEFIGRKDGDKKLQLNSASGAVVDGNTIYGGITCMRIGDSKTTSTSQSATVKNNRFVGCHTAINGSRISVLESGNKFESVVLPWKASNGAIKK